jgi:hypothetical protein
MEQVKTSMCTTMCCSMMNMSMYMHSMCKTQHSALKENSNITDLEVNKYFMKRGAKGDVGMQMCTGGPNYEHAFIKDSLVKMFNKALQYTFAYQHLPLHLFS